MIHVIILTGFLILIGVAGSADLNAISIMETLVYATIGTLIMLTGFIKEVVWNDRM